MRTTDTPKGERMVKILAYLIRNRSRKYTPGEIRAFLEQSEAVDLRNVQRDLKELSDIRESCVQCERKAGKLYYFLEPDMRGKFGLPIERNGLLALFLLKRLQPFFAPKATTFQELSQALRELGSEVGDELFEDLDERLGEQTQVLGERSLLSLDSELLNSLLEGLVRKRRLAITYRREMAEEPRAYTVCPVKLILSGNDLYLVCVFEPHHQSNYYFKVCRMIEAKLCEETFEVTAELRQRVDQRLSRSFGLLDPADSKMEKVVLRFPDWFETLLNERQYHPSQQVSADGDGNTVCRLEVPVGEDFRRWVLSWGDLVTVLKPKSLRSELKQIGKNLAKRYR